MQPWYQTLFENYAKTYDQESFTKGTVPEVDFIETEIGANRALNVLDVGCGTGRHAIELSKRGYQVTGIDLSASQIAQAKMKANAAGTAVDFRIMDARELPFKTQFDVVLMLCEGAFPLMETDEMNFSILKGIARALRSPGKLIMTTLNALFPLYHSVKDFVNSQTNTGISQMNSFDLLTFRDRSVYEFTDDSGVKKSLQCDERYYAPSEITWLLKSLHFTTVEIFGCATGSFGRQRPLTTDDFEMLIISGK